MPQVQALEWCRNAGGYLAALTSNEETDALLLHMDSRELWIDGSDNVTEDLSILQTGEPLTYIGVATLQPNGDTNQNCLSIERDFVRDRSCFRNDTGLLCEQDIYY